MDEELAKKAHALINLLVTRLDSKKYTFTPEEIAQMDEVVAKLPPPE